VTCADVIEVRNDTELAAATASAGAGACIALHPGDYGDAVLPGGVSLLGRGHGYVTLHKVTVATGTGSVIRGVRVEGGGVTLQPSATETRVESVRITASAADGLAAATGSSVRIARTEVTGSARYGVRGDDGADVAMERTVVTGSRGPGVWAECAAGCACPAPVSLEMTDTIVRDSKIVGVSLIGAFANFNGVVIADNSVGDNFQSSGGVAASQCSDLTATGVRVTDNSGFCMLFDDATGT